MSRIHIFSGGTVQHVSPHFAVCAPAYGTIGTTLWRELSKNGITPEVHLSRMAGGDPGFETNEDLEQEIKDCLLDMNTKVIVMAAAVCDFAPMMLKTTDGTRSSFGKAMKRLSSDGDITMTLSPTKKIIDIIKEYRPDIYLVTFKTTSKNTYSYLEEKCRDNIAHSGADVCFGNDIGEKINILYFANGDIFRGERDECVKKLCEVLENESIG